MLSSVFDTKRSILLRKQWVTYNFQVLKFVFRSRFNVLTDLGIRRKSFIAGEMTPPVSTSTTFTTTVSTDVSTSGSNATELKL